MIGNIKHVSSVLEHSQSIKNKLLHILLCIMYDPKPTILLFYDPVVVFSAIYEVMWLFVHLSEVANCI